MAGEWVLGIGIVLTILGIAGIIGAVIWQSRNLPTRLLGSIFSNWTTIQLVLLGVSIFALAVGIIMIIIGGWQMYRSRKVETLSFEDVPGSRKVESFDDLSKTYVYDPISKKDVTINQLKEKCKTMSVQEITDTWGIKGGGVYAFYCQDILFDKMDMEYKNLGLI